MSDEQKAIETQVQAEVEKRKSEWALRSERVVLGATIPVCGLARGVLQGFRIVWKS